MKSALRFKRWARAFTLGETMITVAIVGAFLVLVLMRYTHPLAVGQANAISAQLKEIGGAMDAYYVDNGVYPYPGGYANVTPALFGGAPNRYMNNTPVTSLGVGYSYAAPAGGEDYYVCTQTYVAYTAALGRITQMGGIPLDPTPTAKYELCYSPEYGIYAR